jgi:hypothetical protein
MDDDNHRHTHRRGRRGTSHDHHHQTAHHTLAVPWQPPRDKACPLSPPSASLGEVNGSVEVPQGRGCLGKLMAFVGPGYMVRDNVADDQKIDFFSLTRMTTRTRTTRRRRSG